MSPKFHPAKPGLKKLPIPMLVVNRFLDEIGFARMIDEHVTWDPTQWHVSPGNLAHMLVLLTTLDVRAPLCAISKRLKEIDVEHILGSLIQAEHVNEHNVGEVLERIGKTDSKRLYSLVAIAAMALYEVFLSRCNHCLPGCNTAIH